MAQENAIEYALGEEVFTSTVRAPERPPGGTPPARLTRREREVAALVARGRANRQVAEELSLSERTVETHVRNVLKKLGLKSRVQLAERLPGGEQG